MNLLENLFHDNGKVVLTQDIELYTIAGGTPYQFKKQTIANPWISLTKEDRFSLFEVVVGEEEIEYFKPCLYDSWVAIDRDEMKMYIKTEIGGVWKKWCYGVGFMKILDNKHFNIIASKHNAEINKLKKEPFQKFDKLPCFKIPLSKKDLEIFHKNSTFLS